MVKVIFRITINKPLSTDAAYFKTLTDEMKEIYIDLNQCTEPLTSTSTGKYLRLALIILQRNKNFNDRNGIYHNKKMLLKIINYLKEVKPLEYVDYDY
jgi:hypothetical protein